MATSFVGRMVGAATLNRAVYQEVEQDSSATGQAAGVVILAAVASGIGQAITGGNLIGGLLGGVVGSLIGWLAFAFLCYLIGTSLFKANATSGEVLRCLGFAQTPGILAIIPFIGAFIGGIWALISSFVGLKEALDISTGQTLITIILAFIVNLIIIFFVSLIIGGLFAVTGAITG